MWIYKYESENELFLYNPERNLKVNIIEAGLGFYYYVEIRTIGVGENGTFHFLKPPFEWGTDKLAEAIGEQLEEYIAAREDYKKPFKLEDLVKMIKIGFGQQLK